jgi:hypothetical protein
VTLRVAANTGSSSRTAVVAIADQTITLTQGSGACTYSVSPGIAPVPPEGGTVQFHVTAPAGCSWTASSSADWAHVVAGSGSVTATVEKNTDTSPRMALLTVAGITVAVTQAGAADASPPHACTFVVTPTTILVGKAVGQQTFTVHVRASASNCEWTADLGTPWVVLRGSAYLAGTQGVTYRVEPNYAEPRAATLRIAGQIVTVTQN